MGWILAFVVVGAAWAQEEVLDLPVELDPAFSIGKVHEFLNDPARTSAGKSPALAFEFKYINHGAVTAEQLRQRRGNYYEIGWSNRGPAADVVVRFDYRQKESQDQVRTLEVPFPGAKGSRKVRFSVTGEAYEAYGPVTSWRVSVVRDGKIVAQKMSFIW
ncbi:MAG: hypothetical protein SNJ84_07115 [Verrucomicrobiia bacterium]